ncbi:MAG: hypothetical protein NXI29_26385, partial [bacterium]|nr:hypothetical protein [bacterium]
VAPGIRLDLLSRPCHSNRQSVSRVISGWPVCETLPFGSLASRMFSKPKTASKLLNSMSPSSFR